MKKKYLQVQYELEKLILSGQLKEGDRLPTEDEICRKYRVSRITAARAVNELLLKDLITRYPRRGTFVKLPEYYRTGAFNILGSSLERDCLRLAVENFALSITAHDRLAAIVVTGKQPVPIIPDNCAGVAICPPTELKHHSAILEVVMSEHCPVVVYYRHLTGFKGVEIIIDEEQCAELAVNHLVDLGHQRLAFVGVNVDSSSNTLRYRGFCNACIKAGINAQQYPMLIFHDPFQIPDLKNQFYASDHPTGLVVVSEYHAFLTYDILTSLGLKIPDDVMLVTLDGSSLAASAEIPLTAVEFPAEELGIKTAEALYAINAGKLPSDSSFIEKLSGKLIVRDSSGSIKRRRHEYLRATRKDLSLAP